MQDADSDLSSRVVFTIGHSTLALEQFLALLKAYRIECLVDIRTVPRSRKNPRFNRDTLPAALAEAAIRYEHLRELGGLRHALPDSINDGWRNLSFRGYADYMAGAEFRQGLEQSIDITGHQLPAIMCAEAVPWRCHRSLVADALLVRGFRGEHILSGGGKTFRACPHVMTPFARVMNGSIRYPSSSPSGTGARA